jgi:steroid delta-isomerase-like uncharacterized protein
MSEANKQLMRRWFEEVWNEHKETAIADMMSPDWRGHGLSQGDSELIGPEGFKTFFRRFRGAFPDIHITVHDTIAEGDKVALRWTASMTHLGDHLGFPASGRKANVAGSTIVMIRNGRIVEGWNHMDMGGMLAQLKAP